jgi:adenylosuccinate lyase
MAEVYIPLIQDVVATLEGLAKEWWQYPMLARTHGQPATPTRLGKEIMVFVERLKTQLAAVVNEDGVVRASKRARTCARARVCVCVRVR